MLLTAVDDNYLSEANILIRSCARYAPAQKFYLFLVNSTEERVRLLKEAHPKLTVEHVRWDPQVPSWKGIMCCARSGPIYHTLSTYHEPLIYLDSDTILKKPIDAIFGELEKVDFLTLYRPELNVSGAAGTPHTAKFNSGVIALSNSDNALAFAREYHRRIADWIESGKPVDIQPEQNNGIYGCIDQEFLYLVYEEMKEKLKFKPLDHIYNDPKFNSDSVIWHGKGSARTRPKYVLEKLFYENRFSYYLYRLFYYPIGWGIRITNYFR